MGESKRYLVIVKIRDPHGGADQFYREHIVAQSPAKAAGIAKSRHVGGRFTANYITTRVVD